MISASLLSLRDDLVNNIDKLNKLNYDFIHLDIMDEKFVKYSSFNNVELKKIIEHSKKKLDVHLMVEDIDTYIKEYYKSNIEYITVHYEVIKDLEFIKKIKSYNIKVGISIKPNTSVKDIYYLLNKIDLVLVMSVEPGLPKQTFIENTYNKIKELDSYRLNNNLTFKISVDGGVNDTNISKLRKYNVDILVYGSYLNKIL